MHKQTKAVDVPPAVKRAVWERDGRRCVLCGSFRDAAPNAHVIPRSQGGLGVEENIVTLCLACHDRYDNGEGRAYTREELTAYLREKYPDWSEEGLRYRKYRGKEEEA